MDALHETDDGAGPTIAWPLYPVSPSIPWYTDWAIRMAFDHQYANRWGKLDSGESARNWATTSIPTTTEAEAIITESELPSAGIMRFVKRKHPEQSGGPNWLPGNDTAARSEVIIRSVEEQ